MITNPIDLNINAVAFEDNIPQSCQNSNDRPMLMNLWQPQSFSVDG